MSAHVNGTTASHVENIPDLFSRGAMEDPDKCSHDVKEDVGPDQAMIYPEYCVALARDYKHMKPVE